MPGDYTRFTFDPRLDRAMVLEQQGRVHLDADFNELVAILERRLRVETYDFAGHAVVPASEPQSFRIVGGGSSLAVHRGRMYVDGLLAENHGRGDQGYEPVWGEPVGTEATRLDLQPYLPEALAKKLRSELEEARGPFLLYLDVWQRELTAVEDQSMLEPALGVDTCTRIQTVWQVKALPLRERVRCSDDWSKVAQWVELTAPSPARLTTWADRPPAPADPCAVAPVGGYRGKENRLYRVEVHDGGGAGEATIKWSRDNGAVATPIVGPIADTATKPIVTVQRLGRDDVLRFAPTDWVELLDDDYELAGRPGLIGQVDTIDQSQSTVTLTTALGGTIDETKNPRIRRWDQTAGLAGGVIPIAAFGDTIELEDGIKVKLTVDPAGGTVRTGDWWAFWARAASAGIEELDAAPPRGIRHHYARLAIVAAGKVQDDCRVVFPGECACDGDGCCCTRCVTPASQADGTLTIQAAIDEVARAGGRVCLTAGHYVLDRPLEIANARGLTLSGEGARTVISYVGDGLGIVVRDSVEVAIERLTLTVARAESGRKPPRPTHKIDQERIVPYVWRTTTAPLGEQEVAIALLNTADCRVERCFVVAGFAPRVPVNRLSVNGSLGIGLAGWALRTRIVENVVVADVAIGDPTLGRAGVTNMVSYGHLGIDAEYLASADLTIADNLLFGLSAGIDLGALPSRSGGEKATAKRDAALAPALHLGATRIVDNLVVGGRVVGIGMVGTAAGIAHRPAYVLEPAIAPAEAAPEQRMLQVEAVHTASSSATLFAGTLTHGLDRVEIAGNVLDVTGTGIAATPGNLRVERNDITGAGATALQAGGGVLLALGSTLAGETVVADNTIRGMGSYGIAWGGALSALHVVGNRLTLIGNRAIAGMLGSKIGLAAIKDNTIEGVFGRAGRSFGIEVGGAEIAEVTGNTLVGVGLDAGTGDAIVQRAGIAVGGCRTTRITGNVLRRIGPPGRHTGLVLGIAYGGAVETLDIRGNLVELGSAATGEPGGSDLAISVGEGHEKMQVLLESPPVANDHVVELLQDYLRDSPSILLPLGEPIRAAKRRFGAIEIEGYEPVPPGAGDIAVVDNDLRTSSPKPLVLIVSGANTLLGQNRVARSGKLLGGPAVIATTDGAVIVNANRVETTRSSDRLPSVVLTVGRAASDQMLPHCTVVGNITTNPIWLNDQPLAAPWQSLNIVA